MIKVSIYTYLKNRAEMANLEESKGSDGSNQWNQLFPDKPWAIVKQVVTLERKLNPEKRNEYSPPNFVHPFGDPEIFRKLRSDRRTKDWCEDPDYVRLITKLREDFDAVDEELGNPNSKWHSQIVTTMRVLLYGKESHVSRKNIPVGSGILPPSMCSMWMGILINLEREKCDQAEKERGAGNLAYKAGNYKEAFEKYHNSMSIFPHDMRALLNIGAVYFENKKYPKCIEFCLQAIEVGEANCVKSYMIAKAYKRIAKSYKELEDHQNEKVFHEKSLIMEKMTSNEEDVSLSYDITEVRIGGRAEPQESGNELFEKGIDNK